MRLIQFFDTQQQRHVGIIQDGNDGVDIVQGVSSTRELAMAAIAKQHGLADEVLARGVSSNDSYQAILDENRILVPLDHEDSAHCLVTGTGLTHMGSASTRDKMHQDDAPEDSLTDSMRMFRWGMEGGRPAPGTAGVQPEWFYKGDGSIVVAPGSAFPVPEFGEDAGEEPEVTGLYVIGPDKRPYRLGFAIGNEFSDHIMERRNYLFLAHSKLRFCSFGPELRLGALPKHLSGTSRILRNGATHWEKEFVSGEDNMTHTLENLEYHHFKYVQFLRPGDVHIHFFGTATLSFADGIRTQDGDSFEISIPEFGAPLRNQIRWTQGGYQPGQTIQL